MGCTIKNKKELVLRAQAHARRDHIAQGTYGRARTNGKVEYEGCFIGCLSTPHRRREFTSYLARFVPGRYGDTLGFSYPDLDSEGMVGNLQREFGICGELARVAEDVFEDLAYHSDAIDFLPAFAKAVPEGAKITSRTARAIYKRIKRPLTDGGDPSDLEVRDRFLEELRSLG